MIRPASEHECPVGSGIMISGNACELNNAKLELKKILAQVVEHETTIDQPGMPQLLHEPRGEKIIKSWTSRNDVFIDILSAKEVLGRKASQVYVELAEVQVNASLVLKIVIGDITQCCVDAIVCPDLQNLQHTTGLAHCIAERGNCTQLQ